MYNQKEFEDEVRFAIHDILVHLHKTWEAFSEAARQMTLTPEQAEASLLAKAVAEIYAIAGGNRGRTNQSV